MFEHVPRQGEIELPERSARIKGSGMDDRERRIDAGEVRDHKFLEVYSFR